jgi:hypothetical protein
VDDAAPSPTLVPPVEPASAATDPEPPEGPDGRPDLPAHTGGALRLGPWPFGLIAVVILRLVNAIALIAVGLEVRGLPLGGVPLLAGDATITRAIDLFLGIAVLAGIVGLLLFKRWGWVLTMVLVGLSLAGDLIRIYIGEPDWLALLLHVLAAFYLNGRAVRVLAGESIDQDHDDGALP